MTSLPLTAAQAGVWFAQRLDPAGTALVTAELLELEGVIDDALLAAAIRATVDEVDVLHARVVDDDGEPRQQLQAPGDWPLAVLDLRAEPDPRAAADAYVAERLARVIDPASDRLFDEALLRLADDHVLWLQRIHHIAVDAVGLQLIARRAAERYSAACERRDPGPAPFPPLQQVLADEAAYRSSAAAERDRAFWLREFPAAPAVALLSDRPPRPPRGVHRTSVALAGTREKLQAAAGATGSTWPEVVIAAAGAYVRRLAGDAVLGLPLMARVGPVALRSPITTVNIVPLRVPAAGGARELVQGVREQLRGVRRHQRFRGEELRRALGAVTPERPLYGPLVNVLPFAYALRFGDAAAKVTTLAAGPVDDLSFNVYDRGDQPPRLDAEGNRDRYDAESVALHARRFAAFLAAFAAACSDGTDVPAPLDAAERARIDAVNATAHPVPAVTLTALLEAGRSDAVAVRFEGRELTFAQLHERAERLAARLRALGARPGTTVAVAVPRSLELLVALVGVLRSGAAYLPLDPDQPPGRVAPMLADARPVAAVTTDARMPWPDDLPRLDPAHDAPAPADAPPPLPATPDDPAYVIFTSGSTGRPKGVVVSHRAIVNRLLWMQDAFRLGRGDRVIQKTPVGFDVSVWELFWPLLAGVPLVVAPPGLHRDPAALAALIEREQVTTAHFVPSLLELFADEPAAWRCGSLRRVICSGDALSPELAARFLERFDCDLHNLYGPTEAAVDVTHWRCSPGDASVPIGRPIWNTRTYVLDAALRPQPIGVEGDLYLAGVQLADGYVARPELTAQAFVADPFVPGERMYRTGDRARLRPDGALEYRGRGDDQVKVRGQRIELGEVEAALAAAPGVARAAVAARRDGPGGTLRLVGYVVPADAARPPAPDALRRALAERLTAAMLPSALVVLDALPLSANGKLDRAALPAPERTAQPSRAPATPVEELVRTVFAELLERDEVGGDEDFFALGGDSLLAARAAARLRDALGTDVSVGALFGAPTAAALARRLASGEHEALDVLLQLRGGDDRPPLFCIHPAGGIGWCYAALARELAPGQSVYALQARGLAAPEPLPPSLDAMAADYVTRLRAVQPHGPYRLLGWSVGGVVAHAAAVALREAGEDVELLAILDAYPSDQWRALAEPSEQEALVALLNIAGVGAAAPLTRDGVIAALRAQGSALGSLAPRTLAALVDIVINNARLMREHRHRPFDGDALLFRAAAPRPETWLDADGWRAHVGGELEIVDLDCTHAELVRPGPSARIAALLNARLRAAVAL